MPLPSILMSERLFSHFAAEHLKALREHPSAPKYNFESSDLLTEESLQDVKNFARSTVGEPFWQEGSLPQWMPGFLQRVFRQVPYYREFGDVPVDFAAIPTVDRAELAAEIERFIPDDVKPSELTVYFTSGTSGDKLVVPTEASVSSKVLVLLDRLAGFYGRSLPRGAGKVALAAVFCQAETLTYPSLSHYLEGAATLKVNLHPDSWNKAEDRGRYLTELAPEVITGCPHSLSVLSQVAPGLRPSLMVSSAVALSHGLRQELEEQFQCPVVDVYSLTECKFIAADRGQGMALLCPDLYVEIVDEKGRPLPSGERGEIVVTGGRNRCLPLLRYRTGDYAALRFVGGQPYLSDFQGRAPVEIVNSQGSLISNLDIIGALRDFPLVGFSFSQNADRSFLLRFCGDCPPDKLVEVVSLATGLSGSAEKVESWNGKPQQFRTLNEE